MRSSLYACIRGLDHSPSYSHSLIPKNNPHTPGGIAVVQHHQAVRHGMPPLPAPAGAKVIVAPSPLTPRAADGGGGGGRGGMVAVVAPDAAVTEPVHATAEGTSGGREAVVGVAVGGGGVVAAGGGLLPMLLLLCDKRGVVR